MPVQTNPTQSSEPVAHLYRKYNAETDVVTDHVLWPGETQTDDQFPIPVFTRHAPTLSAAELGQVLESLGIGLDFSMARYVRSGTEFRDVMRDKIRSAIALLEKVKP